MKRCDKAGGHIRVPEVVDEAVGDEHQACKGVAYRFLEQGPVEVAQFPDKICTQTSVTFTAFDGVEYEQAPHYASDEWHETFKRDRNSIESMNEYLKDGPENMKDSARRRLRGLAAQQYILTMMFVTANLRKIARFLRDAQLKTKRTTPIKRKRDREGLSTYARWRYKVRAVEAHELDPPLRT